MPNGRIVVADDNHDAADALSDLLESMGYSTSVAYDGREAVEACAATQPALAILDVEMPVMDGCEAARLIREGAAPPPWIASLTGACLDDEPLRSRCGVFDTHLQKPVDVAELVALVSKRAGTKP
jgi:CheY-like chemotaxis protein